MTTPRLLLLALLLVLPPAAAAQTVRLLPTPPPWLPRYDLAIDLDIALGKAHVRQRVTWTNRATRPAGQVVFNAHARYKVPDAQVGLFAKTYEILRMNPDEGLYVGVRPLEIHKVRLAGAELPFHLEGDTDTDLVVPLPCPVEPGGCVTLDLDFTLALPQKQGRWGQWQGVTQLSNWMPMVAVHDDAGWHPTPYVPWHQPFFNEAGVVTARVTLPAEQKVATTGSIVAERPLDGGRKEVTIQADGVRDFAFLCSRRFVEFAADAPTLPGLPPVRVRVVAFPEHKHHAEAILRTACAVVPYYSQEIGPYPWPELTFVESFFGWNGNECATLVMIDERVFGMPTVGKGYVEYLIAHETCHQWWYNLIGTNGYSETWMDEAMAVHFSHKYLDRVHGRNSPLLNFPGGLGWLPNITRDTYRYSGLCGVVGRGDLGPTVRPLPEFGHIANLFGLCYDKGGKIVGLIEERLGPAGFRDFTRRIYDRYAYRILRVDDYRRELEEYTGRSWEEFFRRWLYGAELPDWRVEKVTIESLEEKRPRAWAPTFLAALHPPAGPCRVRVVVRNQCANDEDTCVGFRLYGAAKEGEREPFQVRVPLLPGDYDEPRAHVEALPDRTWLVEVELPCRPLQIAVDPDEVLLDRDPADNSWKPRVRWRFAPIYTLMEEADLTSAHDRWNVVFGPWLYGAAYSDPWYQRASVLGVRAGLVRTQQFTGGAYLAYRDTFRDIVAGGDATWFHWPYPAAQLGFSVERRLSTVLDGDAHPHRAAAFARHVFQYNSSLYLPPIHYVEAFATVQENYLPLVRHMVPGSERYDGLGLFGIHYRLNYLTPYWDPKGGVAVDVTATNGVVGLDKRVGAHQIYGQFSVVKGLPDLSGRLGADSWAAAVTDPLLHYLGDTRVAARLYAAAALPDRVQFFPLGGPTLLRGFMPGEREGNVAWVGSVEWRFPIVKGMNLSAVDNIGVARGLSGALFYDVGDALSNGRSFGPVAHSLGAGLRLDTTWFGFVERVTLRFDVAKAVNVDTPVQFLFGANMPF